ncbi:coth protein-domain-containing protein [Pilobolus umbonatus]|nr:coth protein-domain-containing protein [Pilobolus umbonatus]
MIRLGLLLLLLALTTVYAKNIIYNVIAEASVNHTVSVIVDKKAYPLVPTGVLYQGEAPIARSHYYYSMTVNSTVVIKESFKRKAIKVNTPNEFFNRSINKHKIPKVPSVYPPLSSRNEVKSDLHRINEIPTINIFGDQSKMDFIHEDQDAEREAKMSFSYISLDSVQTFDDVTIALSGRSSRFVPKLSYTLKMKTKKDPNLYGYKKLKLRAMGIDTSYIREHVCYTVTDSLGVPSTGFSYVRVFINGKPLGLFGLVETFQDPWLANKFDNGNVDYKPGYLYQGSGFEFKNLDINAFSDLRTFNGNLSQYALGQYDIKAGPSEDFPEDFAELDKLTQFIDKADNTTSVEAWNAVLDTEGFIRSMAMENLLGLTDAYMSFANNYYLYRDPAQNNRYTYIPVDMDTSLGIFTFGKEQLMTGDYKKHPGFTYRPLTKKLFSIKEFEDSFLNKLKTINKKLVGSRALTKNIDAVVKMITLDVEWDQTLPRMGVKTVFGDTPTPQPLKDLLVLIMMSNPGFKYSNTFDSVPFMKAVAGPMDPEANMESVKGFIKGKSNAIKEYFKKNKL